MEGGAERGSECQRTTGGRASSDNGSSKATSIPSCCLKARASAPELDAKCHSTVVSGWFSEIQPSSGIGICLLFVSWDTLVHFCFSPTIFSVALCSKWANQFVLCDIGCR